MTKAQRLLGIVETSSVDDLADAIVSHVEPLEKTRNGGMVPSLISEAVQKAINIVYGDDVKDKNRIDAVKWIKHHLQNIK